MLGHPLTRPERTTGPVPLTNTSWLWEFYYPNWGMMDGPIKVISRPGESDYECFDLRTNPEERSLRPEPQCAPLLARTRAHYRVRPGDLRHLADAPDWARR
jgi:hypothetical protein